MNNIPKHFWNVTITAGALLVIFLAVLSIKEIKSIGYVGKTDISSITVSGTGDASAVPDIATFSFGVTETAAKVDEAQTKASTRMNAALKALKDAGIADKDVKTAGYNINPHYEYQAEGYTAGVYRPSKQIVTGYDVSQTVEVKVRDLTKAGTIFQAIGNLGVQNVNGLNFSIEDPDKINSDARAKAIANAQAKAKELASQLGVTIVRVNKFDESNNGPIYPYAMDSFAMKAGAQAAPAPEIPKGEQKVTSNVTITYEIR